MGENARSTPPPYRGMEAAEMCDAAGRGGGRLIETDVHFPAASRDYADGRQTHPAAVQGVLIPALRPGRF
jgi:hypothetical protein